MLTNQTMFDRVAEHLIAQGKPAVDENLECLYRCEDGSMCAIGIFIPDEAYVSIDGIEDMTPAVLLGEGIIPDASNVDPTLASRLQGVHDMQLVDYADVGGDVVGVANFERWAACMANLAEEYNLSTEVMDSAMKAAGYDVQDPNPF